MIAAIMMARDEADIVGHTLTHLTDQGVDLLIVADNRSKDDTRAICEAAGALVLDDPEPGYYQADKMSRLAHRAWQEGAEWVLPCDADEWFYWPGGTLAEFFAACPSDVVEARGWDHIVTHADPVDGNPFRSAVHRRQDQQRLPKVAFRADPSARLHMGNHQVDRPGSRGDGLLYRHLQYRSLEQMVRKVRQGREAYEASNLHWNYGTHWRVAGAKSDAELAADWDALCSEPGLIVDPVP